LENASKDSVLQMKTKWNLQSIKARKRKLKAGCAGKNAEIFGVT
jgi:hypothetical protein